MWIEKSRNGYIEIYSYDTITGAFINDDIIKEFIKYAWTNTFGTNLSDTTYDELVKIIKFDTINTRTINNCGVDYMVNITMKFNKVRFDMFPKKCLFQL